MHITSSVNDFCLPLDIGENTNDFHFWFIHTEKWLSFSILVSSVDKGSNLSIFFFFFSLLFQIRTVIAALDSARTKYSNEYK